MVLKLFIGHFNELTAYIQGENIMMMFTDDATVKVIFLIPILVTLIALMFIYVFNVIKSGY